MLPSSTVENYLKAIYLGVSGASPANGLLAMGQLAAGRRAGHGDDDGQSAGGIRARPLRAICRRDADGGEEKLAALVVRRHRVIELFLVQVMGHRWDEVHEEAEQLEHAVSDRRSTGWTKCSGDPKRIHTAIRFRILK